MFRYTRESRLLKKSEYDHVFKQAQRIVTSNFTILYRKNEIGHARLGLALSKKVIARAHDRNRIKRMLRETFRLRELPAVDIVILARNGVHQIENSVLISKLNQIWDKLCKT